MNTEKQIFELREMASQILSPGSAGKKLFEGIADNLEKISKENAVLKDALQRSDAIAAGRLKQLTERDGVIAGYKIKFVTAFHALKIADDAMFSWFSSEYANSKERKVVTLGLETISSEASSLTPVIKALEEVFSPYKETRDYDLVDSPNNEVMPHVSWKAIRLTKLALSILTSPVTDNPQEDKFYENVEQGKPATSVEFPETPDNANQVLLNSDDAEAVADLNKDIPEL